MNVWREEQTAILMPLVPTLMAHTTALVCTDTLEME